MNISWKQRPLQWVAMVGLGGVGSSLVMSKYGKLLLHKPFCLNFNQDLTLWSNFVDVLQYPIVPSRRLQLLNVIHLKRKFGHIGISIEMGPSKFHRS